MAPAGKDIVPVLGLTCEKVITVPSTGDPPNTDAVHVVSDPRLTVNGEQEAENVGEALSTVMVDKKKLAM